MRRAGRVRVDKELAQYITDAKITISPEKNDELRRKIDRRILAVMISTYLRKQLTKAPFASIMGIKADSEQLV